MIQGLTLPQTKRGLFSIRFNAARSLLLLALFFIAVTIISPYTIDSGLLAEKNLPPSLVHPFGTDALGRDLLTRVAAGGCISYIVMAFAAVSDAIIGTTLGMLSALGGGLLRKTLLALFDLLTVIPQILFGMVLFLCTENGILSLAITLVCMNWIGLARLARGETLRLSEECFFQAAICQGDCRRDLIFKTLLPHLKGPLLIKLTHGAARALYLELVLSYLGVGIPLPHASFGTLLSEGMSSLSIYPWRALFPLFFLSLLLFSLHAFGDQLRGEKNAA